MPSALDVFSFYLTAADLKGQSHQLIVAAVERQEIWDPRQKRKTPWLVMSFTRAKRKLKLNKTMVQDMMNITGTDDYSQWVNMQVMLTPTRTNNKDTITITPAPPATAQPAP